MKCSIHILAIFVSHRLKYDTQTTIMHSSNVKEMRNLIAHSKFWFDQRLIHVKSEQMYSILD
jgi:hypothetical protein